MKPLSLLALQIALFDHYPSGDVSAFVQNQSVVATKRSTTYSTNHLRYQSSSSSSSAFSNDVIELLPVKTPQQKEQKQRRHSIFQDTNAVSTEFPVSHIELWRKSLPSIDEYTDCNDDCNCSVGEDQSGIYCKTRRISRILIITNQCYSMMYMSNSTIQQLVHVDYLRKVG